MRCKGYTDLADMDEDERIDVIGKTIMAQPVTSTGEPFVAGVVVDNDEKADRYLKKLAEKFPLIRLIERCPGPVENSVTMKLSGPLA